MITVDNISKSFFSGRKKIQVLSDISFELERGKILTVIGKSGSGKTTLLNCIGGLEFPDSGRISCLGMDIHSLSKKRLCHFQRNKLGFVFQTGNLLSYLTVFENVVFPLILNGYTKKDRNCVPVRDSSASAASANTAWDSVFMGKAAPENSVGENS